MDIKHPSMSQLLDRLRVEKGIPCFKNTVDNDASYEIDLMKKIVVIKYDKPCKYKVFMEIL